MSLGQKLRDARRGLNLTLKDVAEKAGVSVPFLADLERDLRSTSRYRELAAALGLKEADLITANARVTRDLKRWLEGNPDVLRLVTGIRAGLPAETLRTTAEELLSGGSRRKKRRASDPGRPAKEPDPPQATTNLKRMQSLGWGLSKHS